MSLRSNMCPCCGAGPASKFQWALLSSFLSRRALQAEPAPCRIFECDACAHRWTERGLSDDEAARLYVGYRDETYFRLRRALEPWYSRQLNEVARSDAEMARRRRQMAAVLASAGVDVRALTSVLDWGGDRGQMLKELPLRERYVHEISEATPDPGVVKIGSMAEVSRRIDLVVNCHVLEHLSEPIAGLTESVSALKPGGSLFLELPFEPWANVALPAAVTKPWLQLVARTRWPLLAADFISTAARVKLHVVPPLGVIAVREHLNFFTVESVKRLVERAGLQVLHCARADASTLIAVGRMPA